MILDRPQPRSTRPEYPYYKVQYLDPITIAWKDVQKRYRTVDEAQAALPDLPHQGRVMEVTRKGRRPLA